MDSLEERLINAEKLLVHLTVALNEIVKGTAEVSTRVSQLNKKVDELARYHQLVQNSLISHLDRDAR